MGVETKKFKIVRRVFEIKRFKVGKEVFGQFFILYRSLTVHLGSDQSEIGLDQFVLFRRTF